MYILNDTGLQLQNTVKSLGRLMEYVVKTELLYIDVSVTSNIKDINVDRCLIISLHSGNQLDYCFLQGSYAVIKSHKSDK